MAYSGPPLPQELNPGEPLLTVTWEGWTGVRRFLCRYDSWEADLKQLGVWLGSPHPKNRNLRCASMAVEASGLNAQGKPFELAEVVCRYAEYTDVDSTIKWHSRPASKLLEAGRGRVWRDAGTICDIPLTVLVAQRHYRTRRVFATEPSRFIIPCENKVNAVRWQPTANSPVFEPETMLFLGAEIDEWYDPQRGRFLYGVTYEFLWQPFSHNLAWREPRVMLDEAGNPVTTGPPNFDPVFVPGIAGQAGWDMPMPRLYGLADFNPMLGLPPLVIGPLGSAEDGPGGALRSAA